MEKIEAEQAIEPAGRRSADIGERVPARSKWTCMRQLERGRREDIP
jgi:hypothetical protein